MIEVAGVSRLSCVFRARTESRSKPGAANATSFGKSKKPTIFTCYYKSSKTFFFIRCWFGLIFSVYSTVYGAHANFFFFFKPIS